MTNYSNENLLARFIKNFKEVNIEMDTLLTKGDKGKIIYKKLLESVNKKKELLIELGEICEELENNDYKVRHTFYDSLDSAINQTDELIDVIEDMED